MGMTELPIVLTKKVPHLLRIVPRQLSGSIMFPRNMVRMLATADQYLSECESFDILGYNLEIIGPQADRIRQNGTMRVVLAGQHILPPVQMSQVPPYFHKTVNLFEGAETESEKKKVAQLLKDVPRLRVSQTTYHRLEVGKYRPRLVCGEKFHFIFEFPDGRCVADDNEIKGLLNGLAMSPI